RRRARIRARGGRADRVLRRRRRPARASVLPRDGRVRRRRAARSESMTEPVREPEPSEGRPERSEPQANEVNQTGFRPALQNPWGIPPFLGGVPASLSAEHLRLLGVLTFVLFCENYDIGVLGNALPQLAATFGLSKAEIGDFTGRVILGALPAFLV